MFSVILLLKLVPIAKYWLVDEVKGYLPIILYGYSVTITLSTETDVVPLSVRTVPTATFHGIIGKNVIPVFTSLKRWYPALNVKVQGREYWEILPETLYNEL